MPTNMCIQLIKLSVHALNLRVMAKATLVLRAIITHLLITNIISFLAVE